MIIVSEENKRGGISVQMEHIFPVIKKWLYSEKEIFLREIVSNACDAATKLKRLYSLGEAKDTDIESLKIKVVLDSEQKTITVSDNGIGMDEEELRKYLCQIALSGALDFIEKYEGKEGDDPSGDGIIGHFGLGFYSSFMVSDTVDVYTRSYTGAPAVKWTCSSEGEWEIFTDCSAEDELFDERGTAVVMHISEEGEEYLSAYKLKEILGKYCSVHARADLLRGDHGRRRKGRKEGERGRKADQRYESALAPLSPRNAPKRITANSIKRCSPITASRCSTFISAPITRSTSRESSISRR